MSTKTNQLLEYNLPQDAYTAFDATTLKDFIIARLNENENFTDQNYEGSNLSQVIDIVAFSYHILLFYLNNTASEVTFDQATVYENMNKIVKLIGYKPTGKQTSISPIDVIASASLSVGAYTIKKYSYFLVDNIQYTFNDDHSFDKTTTTNESIKSISDKAILYQGTVGEYPDYTAQGYNFETLPIVVDNIVDLTDDRFIAEGTISVFVKEIDTDKYFTYSEVDNLYLTGEPSRVFERRLNESGHYELRFGNGIFGRKLVGGDTVSINYILSDNEKGIISKNAINGNKLFAYDSQRQRKIVDDVYTNTGTTTYISSANSALLTFNNPNNSSTPTSHETVDEIRENAPKLFASQHRLVTKEDYETLITRTLPGIVNSVYVVNNTAYIDEYIQYFYDICVDPSKVSRVLFNQINFSDSCDFNNINVFCAPLFNVTVDKDYPPFLPSSFKNLILDITASKKMLSDQVVPRDPVYMAFTLGYGLDPTLDVIDNTQLVVTRETQNKINKNTLKSQIIEIIREFFKPTNNVLGANITLSNLHRDILSIEGIKRVVTKNTVDNVTFSGISLLSFNPLWPERDIEFVNQDTKLPFFKFPYLYTPEAIVNNIIVIDE